MNRKSHEIQDIEAIFIATIDEAHQANNYARSSRLQKIQISNILSLISIIKDCKNSAIEKSAEEIANRFFQMQCMLNSIKSSLQCWVAVKEKSFDTAWHHLIDAQEYCSVAMKIAQFEGLDNLESHLKSIEKAIFPGWAIYNSVGMLETCGKCSVCLESFNKCNHLEGAVYMGKLCRRIDKSIIKIDHSAFVKNPLDRRCIFTEISHGKIVLDNFTREPTGELTDDENSMHVKALLINFAEMDYD